jgi:hypothetical protein
VGALILEHVVDDELDLGAVAGDLVLVPLAGRLLDVVLEVVVMARRLRVLAGLVDAERETVDEPDVAGAAGGELGLDGLGPDLVLAGRGSRWCRASWGPGKPSSP